MLFKGRKELDEEWKALRRGWYAGAEEFGEKLQDWLARTVAGRRRESHSGPARMAHGDVAAEAQLRRALPLLGLNEKRLRELDK